MNKEELKNRISMALKDPILQQGFECICKKNADFEKAYNEAEELLDKQIEATYKVVEENKELKKQQFTLRNERNTFLAQNEQYEEALIDFNEKLAYAKTIIKDLLDNSDEYARQRAIEFLEGKE